MCTNKPTENRIDSFDGGMTCLVKVLEDFAAARPLYLYAALNWYEHVVNAGDSAEDLLSKPRYEAVLDLGKAQFWMWFITVADEVLSSIVKKKSPISAVWTGDKKCDYGSFLRERCIQKLFSMDRRVHALLFTEPLPALGSE